MPPANSLPGRRNKLIAIVCSSFVLLAISSCENPSSELKKLAVVPAKPPEAIIKGEIYYYTAGQLNSSVSGDTILRMADGDKHVFTAGILWESYDNSMAKKSRLTADSAICYLKEKEAYFFNHVLIIDLTKHDSIWCEDLTMKLPVDSVFTWKPVHIKTPTQNIFGSGLISDTHLTSITILKASGTISTANKP